MARFSSSFEVALERSSGLKPGVFAIASTSPVFGFMTIAVPPFAS